MLARLFVAILGSVLLLTAQQAQPQPQSAWNPATLKTACDRNDYDACRKLGLLFAFGQSVPVNRVAAARFLVKACDGNAKANCTSYGIFLQAATGGQPDYAAAMVAFGKACNAGDGDGCNKLSQHYYYGWGVARDIERSSRLLGRGCELNDGQSCGVLGARRMTAQDAPPTPEALGLHERACKLNFASSCGILAGWYYAGMGVRADPDWAYALGLKACYEGDRANGCYVAGLVSKSGGKRQPRNPANAVTLLSRACELKSVGGCVDLARIYGTGEGVVRDPAKAASYTRLACEIDKSKCQTAASRPVAAAVPAPTSKSASPPQPSSPAGQPLKRQPGAGCRDHDGAVQNCSDMGELSSIEEDWPAALWYFDRSCKEGSPSGCTKASNLRREHPGLAAVDPAPAAASQTRTVPSAPSDQKLFSIFGVRLGADRFDAVKTMLDRNRNIFFDYFEGTSALNEATRKQISRRLVVSDARFPGIGPQGARVWFDFANEADPILSTVTVLYGPGTKGLQADRIAALTRQYGAGDGQGNSAQWHRVVPGADIALFANLQTGAVDERYAYSREQPSRAAPASGACPAIKVTVRFINASANVMAFKAGSVSSDALFNWTVSAGSIASGQGTSEIWLSTSGLARGTPITADVAVTEDPACGDQVRNASLTAKLP